ncbi:uncharacterized protein Z520_01494 [Fonsecaea multimorphosa CBS 102226]|uniref:Zn(2)-C6 fungal-type domain-containing protein n=1 Tax=Fonsecaea multimorphosa CBS 102226 TaxID=1442371 RepID=A0A0D2KAH3_9EURO|nr:uncharacterized protein Z520_01494 [Fonsecaea multimorphosa CBS 102226]KIY03028.1 hypothetical protein Z520_01494 [Fonsecaea multimorphosa CBS 102226]
MQHQEGEVQSPAPAVKVKKRRRPALSCLPCHRRKLKCGREFPACERCRKSGRPEDCVYPEHTVQTRVAVRKPPGPASSVGNLTDTATDDGLSTRCQTTGTKTAQPLLEQSCHRRVREEADQTESQEMIIYKGEGLLTRFYGHTYHRNLYQQFDQLRPYIQRLKAQCPSINRLRDEIQVLKINAHNSKSQFGGGMNVVCDSDLKSLIPSREVADELINVYVTRFEATHRIFHIPTFLDEYKKYWTSPETTRAASVIHFLLAMATALSCREILSCDPKVGDKIVITRETATTWIQGCESWISINTVRPPYRHLTMLATNCLLVIAKRANHIQANETWITTGALVRSAMAAGYHREADSRAHMSVFHREMRRRLWATVVELDLQAAMERGMPPSLREEDFNSRPPLNITDDAIDESSGETPATAPLETLTDTSFQAIAYRSLGLRLRICALINNSHVQTEESLFDEALLMDEEIMKALMAVPATWGAGAAATATDKWPAQKPLFIRTMLDMLLRQQVILLHMPFANRSEPVPKFGHSRRARLEAATHVLGQFRMLVDHGMLPRSGCDNCQFQAAMAICHELYLRSGVFGEPSPSSPFVDLVVGIESVSRTILIRFVFVQGSVATFHAGSGLAECYISMAEGVLSMMESRITILAKGLNEYYLLTMVLGLVKSRLWTERASSFGAEAVERITRIMIILGSIRKSIWSDAPPHGAGGDGLHSE